MPKNAFTKGPVQWCAGYYLENPIDIKTYNSTGYSGNPVLMGRDNSAIIGCDEYWTLSGENDGRENAQLIAASFNSATACAEMGYDGQKCLELLPKIMKNVDQAVMGNFTMLSCQCDQKRPCAACQLFDLL